MDTRTPGGTLVFHLFGALAQFGRDLLRERTSAVLRAAEARGRKGRRKPVVTPDKLARAWTLLVTGLATDEAICKAWTEDPSRFTNDPHHQTRGPNI